MSEELDKLVARWEQARADYDHYLNAAYNTLSPDGKRVLTEDKAKLAARIALREDGKDDPEVLLVRIKVGLGCW